MLQKNISDFGVIDYEVFELFWKKIVLADVIPRFCGKLFLFTTRFGYCSNLDFGHVANFIIVVKYHSTMSGDAKVF